MPCVQRDVVTRTGKDAEKPGEIGRRGWKQILRRVKDQVHRDKVLLLAAGVAFHAFLALFPTLIAVVSVYGLVFDAADLEHQLRALPRTIPTAVHDLVYQQLHSIVEASGGGLTLALVVAVLVALWSASSGMKGLIQAIGAAYDEGETRSALHIRLLSLAATAGAIVALLTVVALLAVLPAVLRRIGLDPIAETTVNVLRWPLLAALAIVLLSALYRLAPDRRPAQWRWVSWGAVIATALWLAASALFTWYVTNFGSYNRTYGSLGAVIVLMMWLWVSAGTILLGAEINAEMEHQTARDTTRGRPRPIGQRGAYVADHAPERAD